MAIQTFSVDEMSFFVPDKKSGLYVKGGTVMGDVFRGTKAQIIEEWVNNMPEDAEGIRKTKGEDFKEINIPGKGVFTMDPYEPPFSLANFVGAAREAKTYAARGEDLPHGIPAKYKVDYILRDDEMLVALENYLNPPERPITTINPRDLGGGGKRAR